METLKLSTIKTDLPFHMNHGVGLFNVDFILQGRYQIDFDVYLESKGMNLQRPFVWTLHQKQQLIFSILKGIKIPTFSFICFGDDHKLFRVIDGKQRLSSWISFAKNEFPIVWEGKEYYFDNLDKDAKWPILRTQIIGDVGYEYPDQMISDEWKIKWFNLINFAGTPQDLEHMEKLKQS